MTKYHARSQVESVFSMVKAKFRDHVRSKSDVAMKNECLAKFIAHNICCLIRSQLELGIATDFWNQAKDVVADSNEVIEAVTVPVNFPASEAPVARRMCRPMMVGA
jgi:hypothetical protein